MIFFISGATALMYQIVWFKFIALFLGNTTYSQTIVLSTFLGGLAAGYKLIGKISDKSKNPLLIYGYLEIIIGFYGLLFPLIKNLIEHFYFSITTEQIYTNNFYFFLFIGIKLFLSAVLLLIPTIAMGGTFPAMSKYFIESLSAVRKEISRLYFINTFGAAFGVLMCGFFLISSLGLTTTTIITALINITIGLSVVVLKKRIYPIHNIADENDKMQKEQCETIKNPNSLLAVAASIGFISLSSEVLWTRVLINVIGSSTYAISIILFAFLCGIALGSFILTRQVIRRFQSSKLLFICQSIVVVFTLIAILSINYLPFLFWKISSILTRSEGSFAVFLIIEFSIIFLLLLIPTTFSGMMLPIVTSLFANNINKIGRTIGNTFSINTIGAVVGTLLTGLFLIQLFGLRGSFLTLIILGILNLFLLSFSLIFVKRVQKVVFTIIPIFFLLMFLSFGIKWDEHILTSGIFRKLSNLPPESYEDFLTDLQENKILFYKEGSDANVAVVEYLDTKHKALLINGKPDASTFGDMPTQILLGQIPLILHPKPEEVCVIGFGSGVTVNSILTHQVKEVDCIEISKEVIQTAEFFKEVNNDCLADERLKLFIDDAQSFIKTTNKKYDIIISEPSNPWMAGIGNLFSKDFFERCKQVLNPNGMMAQWFHVYEMNDEILRLTLNTFGSVFPYVQIWAPTSGDIIMVGTFRPIKFDMNELMSEFLNKEVRDDLSKIGIFNIFTFLGNQIVSEEKFYGIISEFPINTEVLPRLEFSAPKAFFTGKRSTFLSSIDERMDSLNSNLFVKKFIKHRYPTLKEIKDYLIYSSRAAKNEDLSFSLSKIIKDFTPLDYDNTLLFSSLIQNQKYLNPRTKYLSELSNLYPDSLEILNILADDNLNENLYATSFLKIFPVDSAVTLILKFIKNDSSRLKPFYVQIGDFYLRNSEPHKALKYLTLAENLLSEGTEQFVSKEKLYFILADTYFHLRDYEKVISYLKSVEEINPNYPLLKYLKRELKFRLDNSID